MSTLDLPNVGDEVHHFGWNACSSALCPYAPHPHLERRYLIVPTLRTSRIYILDTKPDPYRPQLVKTIEPEYVFSRTGYSRLHTVHCGPDAIYLNALASVDGSAPGGIIRLDHNTFEPIGRWELDRGTQSLAYDFGVHLGLDVVVTSEWGTPDMFENGPSLEHIVNHNYGHKIHFWDLRRRRHLQEVDLGSEYQMVLELRPAHDPTKAHGFVGVVVNANDLSSSVWTWYQENGRWAVRKVIDVPAEPADADLLPEALKPLGAVPPLITDIDLSLDDRFLYVPCWGTGELRQYDVSIAYAEARLSLRNRRGRTGGSHHSLRIPVNSIQERAGIKLLGALQVVPAGNADIRSPVVRVYLNGSHELWEGPLIGLDDSQRLVDLGRRRVESLVDHFDLPGVQAAHARETQLTRALAPAA